MAPQPVGKTVKSETMAARSGYGHSYQKNRELEIGGP
jgi:hypothetical protein